MSMEMIAQVLRLSNSTLLRAAHKLLMVLAYHHNATTGLICPRHRLLAQELLITERQVRNLVRTLEKLGWLEVRPGQGRGHLSVYRIKIPLDEVIHRKGEISPQPRARKGEILRPEKGTFCGAPHKEVEPRERNLCALVSSKTNSQGCTWSNCGAPVCPHELTFCAYHACCGECTAAPPDQP